MESKVAIPEDAKHVGGEVLLTLAGGATSLLAVALIVLGRMWLGLDFSSLSFWLVIPAGAICTGMVAASGYYFAAIWLGHRPSRLLLVNMVVIGLTTFFLIQYVVYWTFTFEDGSRVADYVGFWEYYKLAIEHQSVSIGYRGRINAASTGELGGFGYVVEGVQLVGFLLGGFAAWAWLSARPFCEACSKYFKSRLLATSTSEESGVDEYLAMKGIALPNATAYVSSAVGRKPLNGVNLKLEECPGCGRQQLALFAVTGDNEVRAAQYEVVGSPEGW